MIFQKDDDRHHILYLLGLLNSRLLAFRYRGIGKKTGGGILEYFPNGVGQLPIRTIDFDNPGDVAAHDRLVELVGGMVELRKMQIVAEREKEASRHALRESVGRLQAEIDRLVYELYGISEAETSVLEGS